MTKERVLTVLLILSVAALVVVLASPIGAASFTPDPTWSQCAHPSI